MSRWWLISFALFTAAVLLPARADEVQLKNGDRLTGTVESIDSGKLLVDTKAEGKLSVDLKDIKTFSTDHPIVVKLADGTVARQNVSAGPDGQVMITPEGAAAPRAVEITQLKQINAPGAHWSGNIVVGGLLARGNTDSESVNASVHLQRRGEQDRLTFDAGYIFGRQRIPGDGKHETANDLFGEAKYDYFFTEKVYGFGDVRGEHDTIAGLDLRLVPSAGAGYQWVDTPSLGFNTEAGISFIHREYAHDGTDDALAARLAYHFTWKINDKVGVFHNFEYFPGLNRIDNYFFDTDAGVRASLTEKMFTEFKIDYRYDSRPAPGRGSNDIRYIIGVGWNF
jgi:putative salt-induced outer membrane protein YdiY